MEFIKLQKHTPSGMYKEIFINRAQVLSYDAETHVLTLSNGQTYHLPRKAQAQVLRDLGIAVPQIMSSSQAEPHPVETPPTETTVEEEPCQKPSWTTGNVLP